MRTFCFVASVVAAFAALIATTARVEKSQWQLALVAGGFSKHYHLEPGEEAMLNKNQHTLGIEHWPRPRRGSSSRADQPP